MRLTHVTRGLRRLVHYSVASRQTAAPPLHIVKESGILQPFTVAVVGAPVNLGQPRDGTELAPAAIRAAGLDAAVTNCGWRLHERGDVAVPKPSESDPQPERSARNAYALGRFSAALAAQTCDAAKDGHFVLTLGGDHSMSLGSIAGVLKARPSLGVLWVDAHADINAPGSASGNMHGMPLSFLLRLLQPSSVPGFGWLEATPQLDPALLVYIGLRDLDAAEKLAIRQLGIKAFTMSDIDRFGIARVAELAIGHLTARGARSLHLSFDIDAVEPLVAPSTGTAVMGGLSYREAHFVCETAAESGLLGSMDITEVNPLLDWRAAHGSTTTGTMTTGGPAATITLAVELIASALGKTIIPRESSLTEPPAGRRDGDEATGSSATAAAFAGGAAGG